MHYASINGLGKSYGVRRLFSGISFHIEEGDKIGLIARNGTGKSTLLKIIAGLEAPDEGSVWIHKDVKVVYLRQETQFDESKTIRENLFKSDHPVISAISKYERFLDSGKQDDTELASLIDEMEQSGAWNVESEFRQILGKLNIHHLNTPVKNLSGGQKKRIALAQAIMESSLHKGKCFLLLDEPTNHLDIEMIEWLENYLSAANITMLVITHDRYFLDEICNVMIEIDEGGIYKYEGNYDYFLEQKSHRQEVQQSEWLKDKNIFRRELEWMRKQPKARTVKSKSRQQAFQDVEERVRQKRQTEEVELNMKMNRLGGKVLEMKKVYKSFDDKIILKGFDYTFKRGERVGVVGPNGVGKSTFLRIALQQEEPDSGKVNHGETVIFGNFSQEGLQFKEDKRAIDYVREFAEFFPLMDGTKVSAAQFMELFGFSGEKQFTFLSKLSGGEKRRLQLLGILFRNPNFLILDEPTNDLDIQTLRTLEEFLSEFSGCVMIVSHDRYFMDRLVDHLLVFKGNGEVQDFPGNYSRYREWLENEEVKKTEDPKPATVREEKTKTSAATGNKLSYKEKFELEQLDKEIPELQKEKNNLEGKLNDGCSFDELNAISNKLTNIMRELDEKEMRWLELSEKNF
jgi:ATP-binding cassette subfamily F protein uup